MRRLPNCNLFAALARPGLQVICKRACWPGCKSFSLQQNRPPGLDCKRFALALCQLQKKLYFFLDAKNPLAWRVSSLFYSFLFFFILTWHESFRRFFRELARN
jgi:hypothetical protein